MVHNHQVNGIAIQETFLPVKGLLGTHMGKEGAQLDYIVHLLRCKQTVEEHYHKLSKEVLKVLQGYVDGINAYAMAHPEEVLVKKAFPISVKEYLIGFNLVIHFFSDTGDMLRDLFGNNIAPLKEVAFQTTGSNGFAFRRKKNNRQQNLSKCKYTSTFRRSFCLVRSTFGK